MNPPGSSSRRPPLAGCSFPRASSDPRGGPAGPAPARALARAPPCRLLVLLLLPPLAASSWPRAWGAAAPSGGYGPGALCIALPAGPCKGKERTRGSVRSRHVPSSAFPHLPARLSPFLILRPHLFHFTFGSSFALHSLKTHSDYCRSHWKASSGCWAPLCNLAEGSPVDGECNEGASCFLGGGACLGMRKGVLVIVGMCCFLKFPSGFIPCCWTKSGEEKLWRYKPLVCNFSKCLSLS